jgi:hypothetical protein
MRAGFGDRAAPADHDGAKRDASLITPRIHRLIRQAMYLAYLSPKAERM